ncbi:MAG: PIN domain-containing protein [Chloroflexota bacterium]|nr:PIN domain-containing protein [Chloroflexota bacterium]
MATMAVDRMFLDTNILVYATISAAPLHAVALRAVVDREQAGVELWVSRQVLREYLAVLTRPQTFTPPIPIMTLVAQITHFMHRFQVAGEDTTTTAHLLTLLQTLPTGGKQVHDANIVATMQANSIDQLLTHNVTNFSRFAGLITIVPLIPPP